MMTRLVSRPPKPIKRPLFQMITPIWSVHHWAKAEGHHNPAPIYHLLPARTLGMELGLTVISWKPV